MKTDAWSELSASAPVVFVSPLADGLTLPIVSVTVVPVPNGR